MRICIDMRMIDSSGIGTYIQNLVPRVVSRLADHRFIFLVDLKSFEKYRPLFPQSIEFRLFDAPIYSFQEQLLGIKYIPRDLDLLWIPHYNVPLFYRRRLLVTVHDVYHLANPMNDLTVTKSCYARLLFSRISRVAEKIITVSEYSARELVRLTKTPQERITVTPLGVDPFYLEGPESSEERPPYFLFVGNLKPHKNLSGLVNAFNHIKHRLPHSLFVVGKLEGLLTRDERGVSKALRLLDHRVKFMGEVSRARLRLLYSQATALVFPSFYEGFGLPPLEAMASGCPVIMSDRASLPEVGGDAVSYCDPANSRTIADKMLRVAMDSSFRESLIVRGRQRARSFDWTKTAMDTEQVIRQMIGRTT